MQGGGLLASIISQEARIPKVLLAAATRIGSRLVPRLLWRQSMTAMELGCHGWRLPSPRRLGFCGMKSPRLIQSEITVATKAAVLRGTGNAGDTSRRRLKLVALPDESHPRAETALALEIDAMHLDFGNRAEGGQRNLVGLEEIARNLEQVVHRDGVHALGNFIKGNVPAKVHFLPGQI